MKLDPLFKIEDNKLFTISDNAPVNMKSLKKIELPWSIVEMEPECYNEEFLAKLRDQLKNMETTKEFAIIVPVADKKIENSEDEESFVAACNHSARRIKDCISVVGFEIPKEIKDMESFVDTLSKKHGQYIYFTMAENSLKDRVISY